MESMRPAIACEALILFLAYVAMPADAAEPGKLARVFLKERGTTPLIVELVEESDKKVVVYDIQASKSLELARESIREIRPEVSEQAAADRVDLSRFLAWKIQKTIPLATAAGKVATVDLSTVYVNVGSNSGLEVGQELSVYRGASEVRDPTTNEVLDRVRRLIGKLQVVEAREKISKCSHVGEFEVEYEVGDEVEATAKPTIAVFPVGDESGNETAAGNALTEELTSGLTKAGIPLVERTRLSDALTELAIQQSDLFDVNSAKKVGKQLGATAIVVGAIVDDDKGQKVNLRLTKVSTGEILLAHAATLSESRKSVATEPTLEGSRPERGVPSRSNLLATSGLQPSFKKGNWQLLNGQLVFKGNSGDGLATIPCDLPKTYRLILQATPASLTPAAHLAMYLRGGETEFIITLDQAGSCVIVDGKDPRSDGGAKYDPVFIAGKSNPIIVDVRNGSLIVTVKGRQFLSHRDPRLGKTPSQDFTLGVVGVWSVDSIQVVRP
jgi:TolB-like protein